MQKPDLCKTNAAKASIAHQSPMISPIQRGASASFRPIAITAIDNRRAQNPMILWVYSNTIRFRVME